MTPVDAAHQISSPRLLPLGFAIILAILATFATVTSDRLWGVETGALAEVQD